MPEIDEKGLILKRIKDTTEEILKKKIEIRPEEDAIRFLGRFKDYVLLVKNTFDNTYLFVHESEEEVKNLLKKDSMEDQDMFGFPDIASSIKVNNDMKKQFARHVGLSSRLIEMSRTFLDKTLEVVEEIIKYTESKEMQIVSKPEQPQSKIQTATEVIESASSVQN